jgi:DNA-binding beta-propeller fold protein YncE
VIETAGDTVIATIPVQDGPEGITMPADGSRIYVSYLGRDAVSIIAAGSDTVIVEGTATDLALPSEQVCGVHCRLDEYRPRTQRQ